MSGWTDGLALALGVPALTEEQTTILLQASREVAHRVERRETPLSTYLAGVAAGARLAGGAEPAEALTAVLEILYATLPPSEP